MKSMEAKVTSSSISFNYTESQETIFLSDEARYTIELIMWSVMLVFNVTGVITNIINIRVFVEQGIRNDSTNIGFVCLSVWDLLCCATLIPYSLCYVFRYTHGVADYLICTAYGLIFICAHVAFQHIGAWTTVYISLMRCCCVICPLKVKLIFSPKTTVIFITITFLFFSAMQTTYGSLTNIVWEFRPDLNRTIGYLVDTPSARTFYYYKVLVLNKILPILAVIVVSINTTLLARKLKEVKKWRQKNSSDTNKDATHKDEKSKPLASKEIELIKFINTVTSIFLVCVLMGFLPTIPILVLTGVGLTGNSSNLIFVLFWIRFSFDAINSSINFFFYIRVSSRYKAAFATAFKSWTWLCYVDVEAK